MTEEHKINIKEILGRNIKIARVCKGITQEKLAELVGVQPSTLRQTEAGKYFVKAETLQYLCEALEINPTRLFSLKNITGSEEEKFLFENIVKQLKECDIQELKLINKVVSCLSVD